LNELAVSAAGELCQEVRWISSLRLRIMRPSLAMNGHTVVSVTAAQAIVPSSRGFWVRP
jgi:hypothetical protein